MTFDPLKVHLSTVNHSHTSPSVLLRCHIIADERLPDKPHLVGTYVFRAFLSAGFGETVTPFHNFNVGMEILRFASWS